MSDRVIGALVTTILGPLIAFGIHWYLNRKSEQALQVQKEKTDQATSDQVTAAQTVESGKLNTAIDAQKKAREDWEKSRR